MIVFRYLNREILYTLFAVTLILLLIFLSNQFIRYLDAVADGRLAFWIFLRLMLVEMPHLLSLLFPLGLYLGILLAYGRLYADNEMTILQALGLGRQQIVWLTLPMILGMVVLVAVLTLWMGPQITHYRDQLLAQIGETSLQTLLPGQFQATSNGKRVFYVARMSVDRKNLQTIFVAEKTTQDDSAASDNWSVLAADRGYQELNAKTGDLFLVTTDGHRYSGIPGSPNYQIIDYTKYGVKLEQRFTGVSLQNEDALPTWALWKVRNKQAALAELQWRISLPLSALLLGLLAIPLSQLKPRQGKYARLVPAILLYIIYANLLFVSRAWLGKGVISGLLGMWWVHLLLLVVVSLLLPNEYQWQRLKRLLPYFRLSKDAELAA